MDLNVKKINESLEKSEATSLEPWYRTNKYGDWILDHLALWSGVSTTHIL
jgi:hypothetical protein